MAEGLAIGRFDQRGVTSRGVYDGGAQERVLEVTHRGWAAAIREVWPRADAVLDGLADGLRRGAPPEDVSAARDRTR